MSDTRARTASRVLRRAGLLLGFAIGGSGVAAASETVTPPVVPPATLWIPTGGGEVRVLDKQKAESRVLPLKLGQTATFETLSVTLRACLVHAPGVPPDQAGFLEISDSRADEPGFKGWMLAHEPGIAMLESPVYSVRISGCEAPTPAAIAAALPPPAAGTDAGAGTAAAGQAAEPPPPPDQALSAPPSPDLEAPPGASGQPPDQGAPDQPPADQPPADQNAPGPASPDLTAPAPDAAAPADGTSHPPSAGGAR